jgi:hypothetical protein
MCHAETVSGADCVVGLIGLEPPNKPVTDHIHRFDSVCLS